MSDDYPYPGWPWHPRWHPWLTPRERAVARAYLESGTHLTFATWWGYGLTRDQLSTAQRRRRDAVRRATDRATDATAEGAA